ncbi:MAG TPA: hypothetical protein V6D23_24780 [Candidatus Obscuribacterales bacterium]
MEPLIKSDLSYDEIVWYRKRWFVVLTVLLFMPATIVIAATGDIYLKRSDGVYVYSRQMKILLIVASVALLMTNVINLLNRMMLSSTG